MTHAALRPMPTHNVPAVPDKRWGRFECAIGASYEADGSGGIFYEVEGRLYYAARGEFIEVTREQIEASISAGFKITWWPR